jgi:hypothetical protein
VSQGDVFYETVLFVVEFRGGIARQFRHKYLLQEARLQFTIGPIFLCQQPFRLAPTIIEVDEAGKYRYDDQKGNSYYLSTMYHDKRIYAGA